MAQQVAVRPVVSLDGNPAVETQVRGPLEAPAAWSRAVDYWRSSCLPVGAAPAETLPVVVLPMVAAWLPGRPGRQTLLSDPGVAALVAERGGG